jgi:hypothetical protein
LRVLSESKPVAKKDYQCDACNWLIEVGVNDIGLTFAEYRQVVKAKRNGWKIRKGEHYYKQAQIFDGEFCVFKGIPAIVDICQKYKLFDGCY